MHLYKDAFNQWNFSKFHLLLHYKDFIVNFGSTISGAGYAFEAAIRFFIREPYRLSSRRVNEGLEMEIKKYAIRSADVGLLLSFFDDPEVRKELYFTLPERPWPTFKSTTGSAYLFSTVAAAEQQPLTYKRRTQRQGLGVGMVRTLVPPAQGEEEEEEEEEGDEAHEDEAQLWYTLDGKTFLSSTLPAGAQAAVRKQQWGFRL